MAHKLRNYLKTKALVQNQILQEKRVRQAFDNVCRNFLGNEKAENYSESLQEQISSHSAVGCNMSLKLNFMRSHFVYFLKTWKPSPMVMAKGYIRIFPRLRKSTLVNGVQICLLTTAGHFINWRK